MINTMNLLAGTLGLLLVTSSTGGLGNLVIEGHELHHSLETRHVDDQTIRHVPLSVIQTNPQLSADAEFVRAIARGGSQGRLDGEGIRTALFALYLAENELGFYGLEAESVAKADQLESTLRDIWAHNASLDRARVHREGTALVVVWSDGVSPECWEAVNATVIERLAGHLPLSPLRPG